MDQTPDRAEPNPEVEVVRHAERLTARTVTRPLARAVLRKRIVTEQRTITIEIRHEEADLELLPAAEDADSSHGAHAALPDLVLYEERIEIVRHLVPVERVRLQIDRFTTLRTVTGTVGHEVVDLVTDPPQNPSPVSTPPST